MDKKPYSKIDPFGKLHIICSLDDGQSKTDIARAYGVNTQTINYIYRQKESILKKYSQKYIQLKEVSCFNLDQVLLEWLKVQLANQNDVTEETLLGKAQEMVHRMNKENIDIEDWLLDFRLRHNIEKFTLDVEHKGESLEEWNELKKLANTEDIYIGGTCVLAHSLSIDMFANGQEPPDYMSVFFTIHALGSNKRKITVVGREPIAETDIGSLPVNYYCNNGLVNQQVIIEHLKDWDTELASEEKTVTLALHIPENCYLLSGIKFSNIRIINMTMLFLSNTTSKIVECFKYHYRKFQTTKGLERQLDYYSGLLDYINMISLAWFSIPDLHVKHIFFPPKDGSLFLRERDTCDGKHSLLHWCQLYNLNLDQYIHCLEEFINCDKELKSVDYEDYTESLEMNINPGPAVGGMEAYQAIKRLLTYIQGEHASDQVLESSRNIEDHLEYGALSEIHRIIASNATE